MSGATAPESPASRPLFFIHIPKTGGNTVVSHLLAFLPVEQVYPAPPQLTLTDGELLAARDGLDRIAFLHGHVEAAVSAVLPLDRLRMFTFIRNPVRLVASHYLYFRHMPDLAMHRVAKALGIADFLRRNPSFGTNPQARYLTRAFGLDRPAADGETFDPVGRGLDVLARMEFVGVTERMDESLAALSEHFLLPAFPASRHNETRASRDEVAECEAVLRRDEFLMHLGADFALRREAEARLDRWLAERKAARMAASLLAGLAGTHPMPWVPARSEDAAVAFMDGWYPQGWVGAATTGSRYWWTSAHSRLLVVSAGGRPVTFGLRVIETVGFDPSLIRAAIGREDMPVRVVCTDGGVDLQFTIGAEHFAPGGKAAVVTLRGPKARSFADLDPDTGDHALRAFAVRDITLQPVAA